MSSEIATLGVIGAGQMGGGIAQVAAQQGLDVVVVEKNESQIESCKALRQKLLTRAVEKGKIAQADADAALARIRYEQSLEALGDVDWVVEAVVEDQAVKEEIFAALARLLPSPERASVGLATNTSSISVTAIAASARGCEDRVVGMHFFNPVPVMALVEVIQGLQTSEAIVERTVALAQRLGKTPLKANDRAGFVSNRVLMPLINEAFYAWMEGVAEPEAIDGIMQLGCNHPMGPLRLADFIGLDTCLHIMNVLHRELGDPKFRPCPLLKTLVAAGRLGDKSGRGVYDHSQR